MSEVFFSGAVAAYAVACVLWLAYLRDGEAPAVTRAPLAVALGVAAHALRDGVRWASDGVAPLSGIGPTLSTLALLVAASTLLLRRVGPRMDVVSAFAMPAALAMLLGSRLGHAGGTPTGATFLAHVAANSVGVAAAVLACAVAVAYLLLERQVKAKRLGALFRRLPSLEQLESLSARSVLVAIPALTVGVITGHVVAARAGRGAGLPWQQVFAMATWGVFVLLAVLRATGALRGRRSMLGTIAGGLALLLTLGIYVGRR